MGGGLTRSERFGAADLVEAGPSTQVGYTESSNPPAKPLPPNDAHHRRTKPRRTGPESVHPDPELQALLEQLPQAWPTLTARERSLITTLIATASKGP